MASSTIPATWAAIHDSLTTLFAAEIGAGTLSVHYGEPRPEEVTYREFIYISGVESWSQAWRNFPTTSPMAREETYALQIGVLVTNPPEAGDGQSFQITIERAFDLLAEVETTLRADQDFGVAGVKFSDPVSDGSVQPFPIGDGLACLLTVSVGVTARI